MSSFKRIVSQVDLGLLVPVVILLILSLTTLSSIKLAYFRSQLIFAVISFFIFLFFSQVNYKVVRMYGMALYILSLVALFLVLLLGIESRGAVRWLDIFGLRIQFSELLKPFLAISLSSFLADRDVSFKTLFYATCLFMPIVFLIFLQPDLGNALVYLFAIGLTLIIAGFSYIWFVGGLLGVAAVSPIIWKFLHEYQRQRVLTFLYPTKDPLGTSYNSIQSIIAVGSGMFFGKGLSEGTQSALQFLPEQHTDFIFATLSEGLGFVGGILILGAFAFLFFRIFEIVASSNDRFSKIFAAFSFSFIFVQFFINIGMNIGILPIVGITLPFVSYGGSSLLSNFIILGFLCSIIGKTKDQRVLEIR